MALDAARQYGRDPVKVAHFRQWNQAFARYWRTIRCLLKNEAYPPPYWSLG
jgi:hypothetical protein